MDLKHWSKRLVVRDREGVTHLVSFPKSGRTWLTLMIGEYLTQRYAKTIPEFNPLRDLPRLTSMIAGVSTLKIYHDGSLLTWTPEQLDIHANGKRDLQDKNVILLIRDPRDIVVSAYFERTRRHPARGKKGYRGTLSEFLNNERGSCDTIIAYYKSWYRFKNVPRELKIVKYEHLMAQPELELWSVLKFLRVPEIDDQIVRYAVDRCSFQNMRKMEEKDVFRDFKLSPGDPDDPESYKTRRGKIGGYKDYLNEIEVRNLDQRLRENLPDFFGYN